VTYIIIEGPIGVGKTVLTRLLAERLAVPPVFEQFEENPFLSNFYVDRARYAFQTEVFFLLNRYRQQQSVIKPAAGKSDLASDYMFAKTKLFAGMNLGGDEFALFEQLYEALSEQVAGPNLVVYLRASVDTLMARIYQRDRSFERSMERAYIERLSQVYDSFFDTYSESPVLKIETDNLDLVRDVEAQQATISLIDAARS
jgi:deoxyadenosine/deoxycytidine kinase